jgi:type VI secretion system secreted protein VgrG
MSATSSDASGSKGRLMTMTGPSAAGTLFPVTFFGRETLSEPYEFNVECLSTSKSLASSSVLHQPACVTFLTANSTVRYCHGIVRKMTALGAGDRAQYGYALEMVPQLWFLQLTRDCRVFQDKTAEVIITTVLNDGGVTDPSFRLNTPAQTRDYTVQMNETDLEFVARLMREEGWYYFFEHTANKHTLVVVDINAKFGAISNASMTIRPTLGLGNFGDVVRWRPVERTTLGQAIQKDYDPTKPTTELQASHKTVLAVSGANQRDVFRWPALSFKRDVITDRTKFEIEAAEARASLLEGISGHSGFIAGGTFTLTNDPQAGAANQSYAVYRVIHQASQPAFGAGSGGQGTYMNSFVAFPMKQQWRDPLLVRPLMAGIYSATVIGEGEEEIHTDEYGRVKVLFPWDRRKDSTADASVWLRVIQPWTGRGWGAQFIPRVKTEVAVAFFDGDIDRPVVVGGLYNGQDTPVFKLPDQKNKSGLRTRSTLKGSANNYSELSFDDTKGKELVFMQAERNHHRNVKASENITIGGVQTVTIGGGQHTQIAMDPKYAESPVTYSLETGNGDAKVNIDEGQYTLVVKNDVGVLSTDGDMVLEVSKGSMFLNADQGKIDVTASQSEINLKAQTSIVLKVLQNSLKIDTTGITLTVGQSTIQLTQQGVTIKGLTLSNQGTTQAEFTAPMTTVSADGVLTLQGALTKIN